MRISSANFKIVWTVKPTKWDTFDLIGVHLFSDKSKLFFSRLFVGSLIGHPSLSQMNNAIKYFDKTLNSIKWKLWIWEYFLLKVHKYLKNLSNAKGLEQTVYYNIFVRFKRFLLRLTSSYTGQMGSFFSLFYEISF